MKKFIVWWETDFCGDLPERSGVYMVEANNEKEAAQKFYAKKEPKSIILKIEEMR